jgi:5-methylcytosine-specific restriction endonuclease McrA
MLALCQGDNAKHPPALLSGGVGFIALVTDCRLVKTVKHIMSKQTYERYSAMLIWLLARHDDLEFITVTVPRKLWYQASFTPITYRAAYVQVIGPSVQGGHVHAIAPHGTWRVDSRTDVMAIPVGDTPDDKHRVSTYMARHLDETMHYSGRRFKTSRDVPTMPRVRSEFGGNLSYQVGLHGYRVARAFLPLLEPLEGMFAYALIDGRKLEGGVRACHRTGVYWPGNSNWLLEASDDWHGVSRLYRQAQDAARVTCEGQVTGHDILGMLADQRYSCLTCEASLLSVYGPSWHVDHITPRARGGASSLDNLRVLCPACNALKGIGSDAKLAMRLGKLGIASPFVVGHGAPIQASLW